MSEHVLVTGASGLVGRAAMEHFAKKGVKTTGISRRKPFDSYGAQHLSVDLADAVACEAAFAPLTDVTQIVFAALHEEDELVAGWTQQRHVKRNGDMLRNTVEPLDRVAKNLRNVTILQGPKAYGVHVHALRPGSREDRDEDRAIPNFYWEQEDYLKAKQTGRSWSWNVIRPALVIGMAVSGAMNFVAALGVYGAILKARGEKLHYPGGAGALIQATDTDLMAHCFDWAAHTDAARNQTYNVTNGEVFTVKDQWSVIAECLGMEPGEARPQALVETMADCGGEWDAIRKTHDLIAPDMTSFIGQSWQFADFVLGRQLNAPAQGAPVSDVKIRNAGFCEAMYTDDMFRKWFRRYREARLLPRV